MFFANTDSTGSKIFRIDGTGTEVEVFELKESTIIFFEPDNEIIQKNSKKQSIFVVDEKMKMRHLVSKADEHLKQVKVFDLSHLKGVLQAQGDQDWAHAHITIRSITIKGVVFSIESEQQQEMPMESGWTCAYSRALPMQAAVLSLAHHKDHPNELPSISLHPSPGSTKRDDLPG